MGVLTEATKMKVLIVLLLTVGLCAARMCYECEQGSGSGCGKVVPGGSLTDPKKTCDTDEAFCKIKINDGKVIERDCSDTTDFPSDYKAVEGDSTKKCKETKGSAQKDCLCNSDLCDVDTMAAPDGDKTPTPTPSPSSSSSSSSTPSSTPTPTPNSSPCTGSSSTIASVTLLTSLLLAKAIFM